MKNCLRFIKSGNETACLGVCIMLMMWGMTFIFIEQTSSVPQSLNTLIAPFLVFPLSLLMYQGLNHLCVSLLWLGMRRESYLGKWYVFVLLLSAISCIVFQSWVNPQLSEHIQNIYDGNIPWLLIGIGYFLYLVCLAMTYTFKSNETNVSKRELDQIRSLTKEIKERS